MRLTVKTFFVLMEHFSDQRRLDLSKQHKRCQQTEQSTSLLHSSSAFLHPCNLNILQICSGMNFKTQFPENDSLPGERVFVTQYVCCTGQVPPYPPRQPRLLSDWCSDNAVVF